MFCPAADLCRPAGLSNGLAGLFGLSATSKRVWLSGAFVQHVVTRTEQFQNLCWLEDEKICSSGWLRPSRGSRRLTPGSDWRMVLEAAGVWDVLWSPVNPTDEEEDEERSTAELLQIDNAEHWLLLNQEDSLNKSQQQPSYLWPGLYFWGEWELCCYAIRSKH